jgi:hypothetical protein
MSKAMSIVVLSVVTCVGGCAANTLAPAGPISAPAPAASASAPIAADNGHLREKLERAQRAATKCVLAQASRLAMQPENPEHIALAAMAACHRQDQSLRSAAELAYGRERTPLYMLLVEEEMRKGVVALVVTLRSRARQPEPEPARPGTRRGAEI